MRGRNHRLIRRVLVLTAGLLLVLAIPATGGAEPPGIGSLRDKSASLAAQSRAAVVELYALESRLAQARADLVRIEARAAALAQQQASAQRRFRAARRTMTVAQRRLGRQLRLLYEQGEPDWLAIILGATSLDEAIEGIETISRTTRATEDVLEQAKTAKRRVQVLRRTLSVRMSVTAKAKAQAERTAAGLETARSERTGYLARLRSEQALTARQISSLEQRARDAQQRAQQVTQQASSTPSTSSGTTTEPSGPASTVGGQPDSGPSEPAPSPVESVSEPTSTPPPTTEPVRPGGTMVVVASMYCLTGTTATGLPVGPGIVATDPSVIPLGTRMTIPGYGEGVAADTGGAIKGNRIDLWVASCKQANIYGLQTVRVTFH